MVKANISGSNLPTNDKELEGMISITWMEDELNKVEYECMEELEMGHIEKKW
jgi:hypothetical protein